LFSHRYIDTEASNGSNDAVTHVTMTSGSSPSTHDDVYAKEAQYVGGSSGKCNY